MQRDTIEYITQISVLHHLSYMARRSMLWSHGPVSAARGHSPPLHLHANTRKNNNSGRSRNRSRLPPQRREADGDGQEQGYHCTYIVEGKCLPPRSHIQTIKHTINTCKRQRSSYRLLPPRKISGDAYVSHGPTTRLTPLGGSSAPGSSKSFPEVLLETRVPWLVLRWW